MTSEEKAKESLIRFERHKELCRKYKHLFGKSFCGFEVPSGWDWIVEKYLEKTQFDVDKNKVQLEILQIKEKFASLRIYTQPMDDQSARLDDENIAYCEALADYTCEKCGAMTREKKYSSGWIVGYCPKCFAEREGAD